MIGHLGGHLFFFLVLFAFSAFLFKSVWFFFSPFWFHRLNFRTVRLLFGSHSFCFAGHFLFFIIFSFFLPFTWTFMGCCCYFLFRYFLPPRDSWRILLSFFFWWPAIDVLDTSFTRFVFFFYRVSPIWVSSFYWLAPGSAEVHQVFSWIFFLTSWPFSFWWWSRLLRWPTGAQFYWDSLGRIENKKNVHVLTERLRISEN